MEVNIEPSWKKILASEFEKEYFKNLTDFVRAEYQKKTVYPKPENLFNAFWLCPFDRVRVVILGQDPYHGTGQAHGLCFSVQKGVANPPSLQNIYKELHSDLGIDVPVTGDLSACAGQGVFLLNATLSVVAGQAGSHQKRGWEEFSDAVIRSISEKKVGVVFLLWGAYAQSKAELIDNRKHLVLRAAHPSPLSAYRGFFGCRHFSQTNEYLQRGGQREIDWQL